MSAGLSFVFSAFVNPRAWRFWGALKTDGAQYYIYLRRLHGSEWVRLVILLTRLRVRSGFRRRGEGNEGRIGFVSQFSKTLNRRSERIPIRLKPGLHTASF